MKIALAGNPNSGKTTLFNLLTGSTAHVGNYPGVTVEKREGTFKSGGDKITIVDLPGIYSLSPYSPEEVVSRNVILGEAPEVIINIVDATNLERNLYLTTQLLETELPVVIALNMVDVAIKNGIAINCEVLSSNLGVPVIPISALKKTGIGKLMTEAVRVAGSRRTAFSPLEKGYLAPLFEMTVAEYRAKHADNAVFRAVKAIERDSVEVASEPLISDNIEKYRTTENEFEGDYEGMVADLRYKFIGGFIGSVLSGKKRDHEKLTHSDKADRVLTHRVWGIPIFLLIMFAVFHLTFGEDLLFLGAMGAIPEAESPTLVHEIFGSGAIASPGVILANLMGLATGSLGGVIEGAMPEGTWYTSLVVNGLCEGVFAVLSFIPQILMLFLFLSILEDTGYMARVAFIMDRAFRRFGLSGKAFMPLLMCFGCAVPGIMATRTLENEKERRMAILLAPFFSCGAKLPIWGAFAACLFGGAHGDLIVFSMYFLGIAVAVLSAILLKKTALKGATAPFIMELPSYHLPQFRHTMLHLWEKLKHYVVRAATIIAGAIVVIWFLTNFDFDFWHGMVDSGQSMLGRIAKVLSWLFVPLGFGMGDNGWMFVVAAFTGLIAKEMVVATMGTFAGMEEDALELGGGELAGGAFGAMIASMAGGWPAAIAFMAFNLLSVPCMAAVAAASGELGSKKKLWFAVGYWMATAYVVSMVLFLSFYYIAVGITLLSLIVLLVAFLVVRHFVKRRRVPIETQPFKE